MKKLEIPVSSPIMEILQINKLRKHISIFFLHMINNTIL